MPKVSIDNMASAIMRELETYANATGEVVSKTIDEVGKATAKEVKKNAEAKFGQGKYSRSWKYSRQNLHSSSKFAGVVHANEDGYRLAHLLENGHAMRQGGRFEGRPHIKPAEEWMEKELPSAIQKNIEGIK